MTTFLRRTKRVITYPLYIGQRTIAVNTKFWGTIFWDAWNPLPFDQKLAWIAFVGQTMAILTLLELFLLK